MMICTVPVLTLCYYRLDRTMKEKTETTICGSQLDSWTRQREQNGTGFGGYAGADNALRAIVSSMVTQRALRVDTGVPSGSKV